jgi:hypothetical protein
MPLGTIDRPEMRLPHQIEFSNRSRIFAWTVGLLVIAGISWPGQSLSARLSVFAHAVLSIVGTYLGVRLVFALIMLLLGEALPRLLLTYLLIVFYAGILATALGLLALPFQWGEISTRSAVSGPMYLASLPSGLAMAAGAFSVICRHYWEE